MAIGTELRETDQQFERHFLMAIGIRTNAAAEILGVNPNTLRSWERRFGYPKPQRSVGNHRQYELVELQTLRDALNETGNISSAIELSRQRQSAPAVRDDLKRALVNFDESGADRAMEESLAIRPVERTVEELLLPALNTLSTDAEQDAELEFACRWAMGWLHGARRLSSAASRPAGVMLLDSSSGQDFEAVHAQALDLALRRAGFRVLALSTQLGDGRLGSAIGALEPTAIIVCGPPESAETAAQLLTKIREFGVDAPLFGYRTGDDESETPSAIPSAGNSPSEVTSMLNDSNRRRNAAPLRITPEPGAVSTY